MTEEYRDSKAITDDTSKKASFDVEAEKEAVRIRLTAEARANAESARIGAMITALQESGIEFSSEMLREIVVDSIQATEVATEVAIQEIKASTSSITSFRNEDYIISKITSWFKRELDKLKDYNSVLLSDMKKLQIDVSRLRELLSPRSLLEGKEDIEEEIKHQSLLRKEYLKRLRSLEIEEARKGANTPPEIETEITDIRVRVSEVEAKIKILTFDFDQIKSSGNSKDDQSH